jgi:hypothetical protein
MWFSWSSPRPQHALMHITLTDKSSPEPVVLPKYHFLDQYILRFWQEKENICGRYKHPAAKKKKRPNFMWHGEKHLPDYECEEHVHRNIYALAADQISSGKISFGTNQPSRPHDHAKAAT